MQKNWEVAILERISSLYLITIRLRLMAEGKRLVLFLSFNSRLTSIISISLVLFLLSGARFSDRVV